MNAIASPENYCTIPTNTGHNENGLSLQHNTEKLVGVIQEAILHTITKIYNCDNNSYSLCNFCLSQVRKFYSYDISFTAVISFMDPIPLSKLV